MTTMSLPVAEGAPGVRAMLVAVDGGAATMNETILDVAPLGFCTTTLKFEVLARSDELSVTEQFAADWHSVLRVLPAIRTVEPGPELVAVKLAPAILNVKPAAPAVALEGRSDSTTGPVVMVTVADADLLTSSLLVADTLSVFGEGATAGAVYNPVASTVPQGAPAPAQELPRT